MKRNFKFWHEKKLVIEDLPKRPFFHEREIWFTHLGVNIGSEQDGVGGDFLRPVIVARKFNNEIFWGIPLTKAKQNQKRSVAAQPFYFAFSFIPEVRSEAILSQIRLIDARRLGRKVGEISKTDYRELKKKLIALLP